MFAEKEYVNTLIGLIFILIIGVLFYTLFKDGIEAVSKQVFKHVNDLFPKIIGD